MNENPDLPVTPPETESLADTVATLRLQLQATLIILIMISGAFNLYLLRQYTTLRKEVAALEPQVGQMIGDYQRVTVPLVNKFLSQLTDYAQTHPEFKPILEKYRIRAASTGDVPATAQPAKSAAPTSPPAKAPVTGTPPKK